MGVGSRQGTVGDPNLLIHVWNHQPTQWRLSFKEERDIRGEAGRMSTQTRVQNKWVTPFQKEKTKNINVKIKPK